MSIFDEHFCKVGCPYADKKFRNLTLSMPKQGCQIWADMRSPRVKQVFSKSMTYSKNYQNSASNRCKKHRQLTGHNCIALIIHLRNTNTISEVRKQLLRFTSTTTQWQAFHSPVPLCMI